jgi:hypothetical protein
VRLTVRGTIAGQQVFRFSLYEGDLLGAQIGQTVFPMLKDQRGRPTRLRPEEALTERANLTLNFYDDPDAAAFDPAVFTVTTGGAFFQRLVVAQPDYRGSLVEVLRGFVAPGFTEADFQIIYKGRVEDINFDQDTVSVQTKDVFTFSDRELPAEVSDSNLLAGAMIVGDVSFTMGNGNEFSDPAFLPSKDYFPVAVRIDTEDIILNRKVGNVLTVQENLLARTEEFNLAPWTLVGAITATADKATSPWGGVQSADLLAATAPGASIYQDGAWVNSSIPFTFSVWMKHLTLPTITLTILDPISLQTASVVVPVTSRWARYQVSITFSPGSSSNVRCQIAVPSGSSVHVWGGQLERSLARGPYVRRLALGSTSAGRGAYGSVQAGHALNAKVTEIMTYRHHLSEEGIHPIVIIRDLVNRLGIAPADVDQESFDRDFDFNEAPQFRRGRSVSLPDSTITRPKNVLAHVKEVREQALIDLWMSEEGLVKAKSSFRPPTPGETVPQLTDEGNIAFRSARSQGNNQSRYTRVFVHFNQIAGTDGDRPSHFTAHQVGLELGIEQASGARVKPFFSQWIWRTSEASALAGRFLRRFKRGAKIAFWDLELKDDIEVLVGTVVSLDSLDYLIPSGSAAIRGKTRWQIVFKDGDPDRGDLKIEALEFPRFRFGFITPAAVPVGVFPNDYDLATQAQKDVYCFIGTAVTNLVGTPPEDGYYIL